MINTIFFGINILLLIAVWHFILKKTILDHYRDQLFDLRNEVREFFIDNDIPLDSIVYKNLRDLLNAHLRFTERFTFLKFIILEAEIRKNTDLQDYLKAEIEKRFKTENPKLQEFVHKVRGDAVIILKNHMVKSSGLTWLLVFIIGPFVIAWNLIRVFKHATKTSMTVLSDGFFYSIKRALVFIFSIKGLINKTIKQDLLEECSYRVGADCGVLCS